MVRGFATLKKIKEKCCEWVPLLWVDLKVSWYNFTEYLKVVFRYYRNVKFLLADLTLLSAYLFKNPYKISKAFLQKKGEKNIHAYGETPITTLDSICKKVGITDQDVVYELGCGRGRTCFWISQVIGAKTVGMEIIPDFVSSAQGVVDKYALKNLEFVLQDFKKANFKDASVIYLYGTLLEETAIRDLMNQLAETKPGTSVITISYPLTDYDNHGNFELMKRFPVKFPWGETDAFMQIRN